MAQQTEFSHLHGDSSIITSFTLHVTQYVAHVRVFDPLLSLTLLKFAGLADLLPSAASQGGGLYATRDLRLPVHLCRHIWHVFDLPS